MFMGKFCANSMVEQSGVILHRIRNLALIAIFQYLPSYNIIKYIKFIYIIMQYI